MVQILTAPVDAAVSATGVVGANGAERVNASGGAITRTGPAAGTSIRWSVKKVDTSANVVTVSYVKSDGTAGTIKLLALDDAVTFRAAGSGYVAESRDYPQASLTTRRANDTGGVVFLGDSITASGDNVSNETPTWSSLLPILTGQRLRRNAIKGVPGNTTAQMLARYDTDVTPNNPRYVAILGGTNDADFPTAKAGLTALYDKADSLGHKVIACTIPPRLDITPQRDKPHQLAVWITETAMRRGYPLLDFFSVLVDPTTGGYLAGFDNGDSIHPNFAGHLAMAQAAVTALSPSLPARGQRLVASDQDVANLLLGGAGTFTRDRILGDGTTHVTSTPYGFAAFLAGAGAVVSRVATGGINAAPVGNWTKLVHTAASGNSSISTYNDAAGGDLITSGFSVGDRIALCGRIQTTGCAAGGAMPKFQITANAGAKGGTVLASAGLNGGAAADIPDGIAYYEITVPAGTLSLLMTMGLNGPNPNTGTAFFGQVGILNLTALGLA